MLKNPHVQAKNGTIRMPLIERSGGAQTPRITTPKGLASMCSKSNICSVDGCELPVRVRGWCNRHYLRWYRHGHPLAGGVSLNCHSEDPIERFWRKVEKTGGCWEWTAALNSNGYGSFWDGARYTTAYRFSWELHFSPIPSGLYVCHHCDNPLCVRPDHLFLGSHADNMADRDRKKRWRVTPQHGSENPASKLHENDVKIIRDLHAHGVKGRALADRFGVSEATISNIVHRKIWKNIS